MDLVQMCEEEAILLDHLTRLRVKETEYQDLRDHVPKARIYKLEKVTGEKELEGGLLNLHAAQARHHPHTTGEMQDLPLPKIFLEAQGVMM